MVGQHVQNELEQLRVVARAMGRGKRVACEPIIQWAIDYIEALHKNLEHLCDAPRLPLNLDKWELNVPGDPLPEAGGGWWLVLAHDGRALCVRRRKNAP